jgi:hypothetical protein
MFCPDCGTARERQATGQEKREHPTSQKVYPKDVGQLAWWAALPSAVRAVAIILGSFLGLILILIIFPKNPEPTHGMQDPSSQPQLQQQVDSHTAADAQPSPTSSRDRWLGRDKEAIRLVRSYRNPNGPRRFDGVPTGKRLEEMFDSGSFGELQMVGEVKWTTKQEEGPVYHVQAILGVAVSNGPPRLCVYAWHANLDTREVVPAPDVRPTRPEKVSEEVAVFLDTRHLMEHMDGE